MNLTDWNRAAWDKCVAEKNEWTVPVSPEIIARARSGDWSVILTPSREVVRDWFPESMNGNYLPTLYTQRELGFGVNSAFQPKNHEAGGFSC